MPQATDIFDDRHLQIEPLETRKIAKEFEILGRVAEQPQFDIAPAVPQFGETPQLRIVPRLLDREPDARRMQRTPGIETGQLDIDVAETFLKRRAGRCLCIGNLHRRSP